MTPFPALLILVALGKPHVPPTCSLVEQGPCPLACVGREYVDSARSGTVYSLDTGLGPFVTFVRAAGKIGQTEGILGQGLTGTTGVTINGTPASFTVVSDTFITATIPPGATTGYVTVTTPTGVLTSNVPFRVIP